MQTTQRRRGATLRATRDDRTNGYSGNLFCDETLVTPMKCFWDTDKKKEAITTFRLLPEPDPDHPGKFMPGRMSVERQDYSGWIMRYLAWRGAGDPPVTFFLFDPEDPRYASRNKREIEYEMPACTLSMALNQAKKAGRGKPHWFALTQGSKDRGPIIKRPNWMYVAYAAVYEHGPDGVHWDAPLGLGRKAKPILLDMGSDIGQTVIEIVEKRQPDFDGVDAPDGTDYGKVYYVRDPVSIKNGVFFRAFSMKSKDPRRDEKKGPNPPKIINPPAPEDNDREKAMGFHCYAARSPYKGHSASLEGHEQDLWGKLKPFASVENGGIFKFPTIEEQVALLANHIVWEQKPCVDLLEYAWEDRHPEWVAAIPDDVRDRFKAKKVVAPNAAYDEDEDEEDEDERAAARRKARSKASARDDDEEEDEAPKPAGKPKRKPAPAPADDPDDEDEDDAPADDPDDEDEDDAPDDDDDAEADAEADEDEAPKSKAGKSKAGGKPRAGGKPKVPPAAEEDDEEDEDPKPARKPARKSTDRSVPKTSIPDDDEDDDAPSDADEDEDEDDAPDEAEEAEEAAPADDDEDAAPPPKASRNGKKGKDGKADAAPAAPFEPKPKKGGKGSLDALVKTRLKGK
jgi:hypothetical protein